MGKRKKGKRKILHEKYLHYLKVTTESTDSENHDGALLPLQ
jgi:hypothetical protein